MVDANAAEVARRRKRTRVGRAQAGGEMADANAAEAARR